MPYVEKERERGEERNLRQRGQIDGTFYIGSGLKNFATCPRRRVQIGLYMQFRGIDVTSDASAMR